MSNVPILDDLFCLNSLVLSLRIHYKDKNYDTVGISNMTQGNQLEW